ncbi:DUF2065 domain-containing protein [Alteromonas sp. AMM-1]|uniref:DUF2065 domain-containing protein n=1 Tax=Alteromonas sp. AMM-1 TaxID=3394233 RepID=UPI0039A63653
MPDWFWPAIAMVVILEGLGPLCFPNRWKAYIKELSSLSVAQLRQIGGVTVIIGALWLLWATT